MSRGTRRTRRAVTLWPEADNLSVVSGGLGGPSTGEPKARPDPASLPPCPYPPRMDSDPGPGS